MLQAQNLKQLFQGLTVPTGTTTQKVGPGTAGQYGLSPLSQISGLISGIGGMAGIGNTPTTTPTTNNLSGFQTALSDLGLSADAIKALGSKFGLFAKGGSVKPIKIPDHVKARLQNKVRH